MICTLHLCLTLNTAKKIKNLRIRPKPFSHIIFSLLHVCKSMSRRKKLHYKRKILCKGLHWQGWSGIHRVNIKRVNIVNIINTSWQGQQMMHSPLFLPTHGNKPELKTITQNPETIMRYSSFAAKINVMLSSKPDKAPHMSGETYKRWSKRLKPCKDNISALFQHFTAKKIRSRAPCP